MSKDVLSVLKYFAYFRYFPTFEELHTFYPRKISSYKLSERLKYMEKNRLIKSYFHNKLFRYTLQEYSRGWNEYLLKEKFANIKKNLAKTYITILSFFPQIKFIGFSGSLAMSSASKEDDIDLFVITAKERLFTARFIGIFLAFVMGLKRRRGVYKADNKICLNLLFDEDNLAIPKDKRTTYVAHEVLQMKPIFNKDSTYERFLRANRWAKSVFPNSTKYCSFDSKNIRYLGRSSIMKLVGDVIEYLLKKLQLALIRRHTTTERIGNTQLWFFPDDFEKRLRSF